MVRLKALMSHYAGVVNKTVHLHVMMFERVLTPVQFAKLCVYCYPYIPAGECIMREGVRLWQETVAQGSSVPALTQG